MIKSFGKVTKIFVLCAAVMCLMNVSTAQAAIFDARFGSIAFIELVNPTLLEDLRIRDTGANVRTIFMDSSLDAPALIGDLFGVPVTPFPAIGPTGGLPNILWICRFTPGFVYQDAIDLILARIDLGLLNLLVEEPNPVIPTFVDIFANNHSIGPNDFTVTLTSRFPPGQGPGGAPFIATSNLVRTANHPLTLIGNGANGATFVRNELPSNLDTAPELGANIGAGLGNWLRIGTGITTTLDGPTVSFLAGRWNALTAQGLAAQTRLIFTTGTFDPNLQIWLKGTDRFLNRTIQWLAEGVPVVSLAQGAGPRQIYAVPFPAVGQLLTTTVTVNRNHGDQRARVNARFQVAVTDNLGFAGGVVGNADAGATCLTNDAILSAGGLLVGSNPFTVPIVQGTNSTIITVTACDPVPLNQLTIKRLRFSALDNGPNAVSILAPNVPIAGFPALFPTNDTIARSGSVLINVIQNGP